MIKKHKTRILVTIGLLAIMAVVLCTPQTFAAKCAGANTTIVDCEDTSTGFWAILRDVVNFLTMGLGLLATVGFVIAGFKYLTARDDPSQIAAAKKRIAEVVIGILFYGLFYVLLMLFIPGGASLDPVPVTSITVNESNITMKVGEEREFSAIIEPAEARVYYQAAWSSSNEAIVTISTDGYAVAKAAGNATITATTGEGTSTTITITVEERRKAETDTSGDSSTPITPVNGDSTNVACASGTIDLGIEDEAYLNGVRTSIRICEIPNIDSTSTKSYRSNGHIVVNSRVSGAYYALGQRYSEQHSGAHLKATESFRTNERQAYFYNCYLTKQCNNGNLASKPGYSNHQLGLAVDFSSITSWNSPLSQWFYANLEDFGLVRNVKSECWHVNPKGM